MQSIDPKVSVIVPLYNRERFLPQLQKTLDSQEYKNFEVILVDDGSTDNTDELLQQFSLSNGQDIIHLKQANAGPYAARNYGLSVAKGEFIAFQDSDDEWPSYHLEEFVAALTKFPEIDWIFGSLRRIDHITGKTVQQSNFVTDDGNRHPFLTLKREVYDEINIINDVDASKTAIAESVPGSTQCALVRRTVFDKHTFDGSYRTAYDRFFAIKSVMRGFKFAYVEATHQIYHIHDSHISLVTGVTPEKVERSANTMLRGYYELFALATTKGEKEAINKQLARVNAWELSIALKDMGKFKESSQALRKAMSLVPLNFLYLKSYFVSLIRLVSAFIGKQNEQ